MKCDRRWWNDGRIDHEGARSLVRLGVVERNQGDAYRDALWPPSGCDVLYYDAPPRHLLRVTVHQDIESGRELPSVLL